MTFFSLLYSTLLYALLLPLSTCPDKISQQSRSYTPIFCLISYVSFVYCIISVITQTASRCIIALLTHP